MWRRYHLRDMSLPAANANFVAPAVSASVMDSSKSTAKGEGLFRAKAGVPAVFQIKAADRFGNRITRATGMTSLAFYDSLVLCESKRL